MDRPSKITGSPFAIRCRRISRVVYSPWNGPCSWPGSRAADRRGSVSPGRRVPRGRAAPGDCPRPRRTLPASRRAAGRRVHGMALRRGPPRPGSPAVCPQVVRQRVVSERSETVPVSTIVESQNPEPRVTQHARKFNEQAVREIELVRQRRADDDPRGVRSVNDGSCRTPKLGADGSPKKKATSLACLG